MSKRKRLPQATTMITQIMPSVAAGVEIDLADTDYVVGVSYSAKKRMWRSYLHIGKKQVFHAWLGTKSEAIQAREHAVVRFGRSASQSAGAQAFERSVKPPKYRDLDKTLHQLDSACRSVSASKRRIIHFGLTERVHKDVISNGGALGFSIGAVIAFSELLVLDGAVSAVDIEAGMKLTVKNLKEEYS
jgi:hypothetical protein